jgi:hypothetical protein
MQTSHASVYGLDNLGGGLGINHGKLLCIWKRRYAVQGD